MGDCSALQPSRAVWIEAQKEAAGGWVGGGGGGGVCDADPQPETDHQQCGAQTLTYTPVRYVSLQKSYMRESVLSPAGLMEGALGFYSILLHDRGINMPQPGLTN